MARRRAQAKDWIGRLPHPRPPLPDELRSIAGDTSRLMVSTDEPFFAWQSGQAGELREATTGMRLTKRGQLLASQEQAVRGMAVLAASDVGFTAAAEAIGRAPHQITDPQVRSRLLAVLQDAHRVEPATVAGDGNGAKVAVAHPRPVAALVQLRRSADNNGQGRTEHDLPEALER